VQNRFDLGRIDVVSKADQHLFAASDDGEISLRHAHEIAGSEPAVRIDRLRCFLRRPVITLHHTGTAHPKLADLAGPNVLPRGIHEPCFQSWKGSADAA